MFVLLTAIALASQAPAAQPPSPADPVVCKRSKNADVGTHMRPEKICMKKSDWEALEKNTQNELQTLQDRAAFDPGHSGSVTGPH